ncbi:hypothetical protein O181_020302 [Austropuccinia psidii MF-1]|uniref:RING-type domain-containing protein n=1 Tax=Austropuccinia psidii MF-1 TaxID=1389203 RepID=A0A9Q3CD79_9BASI|nr:hypothetical protein [Austropuccinia psidii MF-1]
MAFSASPSSSLTDTKPAGSAPTRFQHQGSSKSPSRSSGQDDTKSRPSAKLETPAGPEPSSSSTPAASSKKRHRDQQTEFKRSTSPHRQSIDDVIEIIETKPEKIPKVDPSRDSQSLANLTCSICLSPPSPLVVTKCGHVACGGCLAASFLSQQDPFPQFNAHRGNSINNGKCPVCRAAYTIVAIYLYCKYCKLTN